MDKVLPGQICILIRFNVKTFEQVTSQQMWMHFNTFPSSSPVTCMIRINFLTWLQFIKDGSCCNVNDINLHKFYPGRNST